MGILSKGSPLYDTVLLPQCYLWLWKKLPLSLAALGRSVAFFLYCFPDFRKNRQRRSPVGNKGKVTLTEVLDIRKKPRHLPTINGIKKFKLGKNK